MLTISECKDLGWGDLINATVEFCSTLQDLSLDVTEFCILNGLVVCFPGWYIGKYSPLSSAISSSHNLLQVEQKLLIFFGVFFTNQMVK